MMNNSHLDDGNEYAIRRYDDHSSNVDWLSDRSYEFDYNITDAVRLTLSEATEAMLMLKESGDISGDYHKYECLAVSGSEYKQYYEDYMND